MATGILRRFGTAARAPAGIAGPESAAPLEAAPRLEWAPVSLADVYERHFGYVWRCLRGLGVETQNVDDAVHEVFLVVQRRLPEFDGAQARLTTWLYEIALRVAHRYRAQIAKEARRSVSIDSVLVDNAASASARHVGAGLQTQDAHAEVELTSRIVFAQRALEVLDRDKREVFVLAFVEQRTAPEIAEITRAPLNTVYSRIRAAKRLFAAEVERLAGASGEEPREPGVKP